MTAILLTLGAVLSGGGFAVYPWTSTSAGRTTLAAVLWFLGFAFFTVAVVVQLRSDSDQVGQTLSTHPDGRWFAVSDGLGTFANEGKTNALLLPQAMTTVGLDAELNKYQEWIRRAGDFVLESLGAAAHHRFNIGRGETSREQDDLRRLYDIRLQRLQYILDHRQEFPINPGWSVSSSSKMVSQATPSEADRRQLLHDRILAARAEGQRMLRFNIDRLVEESPPWQREVYDLLDKALNAPMEAHLFDGLGVPIPDQPPNVGLGQRIGNQVPFLTDLLPRLDHIPMRDEWNS